MDYFILNDSPELFRARMLATIKKLFINPNMDLVEEAVELAIKDKFDSNGDLK